MKDCLWYTKPQAMTFLRGGHDKGIWQSDNPIPEDN